MSRQWKLTGICKSPISLLNIAIGLSSQPDPRFLELVAAKRRRQRELGVFLIAYVATSVITTAFALRPGGWWSLLAYPLGWIGSVSFIACIVTIFRLEWTWRTLSDASLAYAAMEGDPDLAPEVEFKSLDRPRQIQRLIVFGCLVAGCGSLIATHFEKSLWDQMDGKFGVLVLFAYPIGYFSLFYLLGTLFRWLDTFRRAHWINQSREEYLRRKLTSIYAIPGSNWILVRGAIVVTFFILFAGLFFRSFGIC